MAQQHQVELAQTRGQLEAVQRMLQGAAPDLPQTRRNRQARRKPSSSPLTKTTCWRQHATGAARVPARDQQTHAAAPAENNRSSFSVT